MRKAGGTGYGTTGSTRRRARSRNRYVAFVAMVAVLLLTLQGSSSASHLLGNVELDGNALDEAAEGDDWDTILGFAPGTPSDLRNIFIADGSGNTIFTTGGSKDDLDIPNWQCTDGNVPDKDDILNAYAAAYNGGGDLKLYFGADRFANNGDAQIGFWFLQDDVSCDPAGTGMFSGTHQIGDILVLSDFTQGGNVSTIRIFEWVGSGGDTNDVLNQVGAPGQDCTVTGPGDPVCATVNSTATTAPWSFTPKFGTAGTFPAGSFYEGGVNLGELGVDFGCGGTFIAETRSSQSIDAQLKDYALGSFQLCEINVEKEGDELSKAGDTVSYTVTITNDGAITMFKESIDDSVAGDLANEILDPNVSNFSSDCDADLDPLESCTITYDYTVQGGDPDPLDNTVDVVYDSEAGLAGDEASASDDHSVNLFQPDLEVTKVADTDVSKEGDVIGYTVTIDNTSSADSPALVFDAIDDTVAGDLLTPALNAGVANYASDCGATLAAQSSCEITYDYTVQVGDPDPLGNTVSVETNPDGFPNDIDASDSAEVNLFQPDLEVTKVADTDLSKEGDVVGYTITIENDSSADSPDLVFDAIDDSVAGDLLAPALNAGVANFVSSCGASLAAQTSCEITYDYTVQVGDPDPLGNTVTVETNPDGFPNDIDASDGAEVNLFQPDLEVTKEADTDLSKEGDVVGYTITIENDSSADSPDLVFVAIDDSVAGDLLTPSLNAGVANYASDCGFALAAQTSCEITYDYTVQVGDPDPLMNTVTVETNPFGFPNDIDASDSAEVSLFQPDLEVTKEADTDLSKEGDVVGYTITIENDSSADSPDLVFVAIDDSVAGDLLTPALNAGVANYASDCGFALAAQTSCEITYDYTVQVGDSDPLVNTVTVETNPFGFPNDIDASDSAEVNLFQPAVEIEKDGDPFTKIDPITGIGDTITYEFTITNTSSPDSPNLQLVSVIDTGTGWAGLGDLTADALAAGCDDLAPAAGCNFTVDYQYQPGDPDPDLENTVEVLYNPAGFPNEITDSDTHNVTVVHPDFMVTKSCLSDPVPPGAAVSFQIIVWNTGDVPLVVDILDPVLGINLIDLALPVWVDGGIIGVPEAGEQGVIVIEAGVIAGDQDVTNEVFVTATLPPQFELENVIERQADATCEVEEAGATRTLGFWRTHVDYGTHVLNAHLGGTMDLGWKQVTSADELYGIFWASPARESDDSRRGNLCRTKLHASWQLAAAILNDALDNGAVVPIDPVTGLDIITAAQNALVGNNRQEIIRLAGLLGDYNESGDDVAIVDLDGTIVLPADPNEARNIADFAFADC